MSKLEDLQPGVRLAGVIPGQSVTVIAVQPHGADTIELTYKTAEGALGQRVLSRDDHASTPANHNPATLLIYRPLG